MTLTIEHQELKALQTEIFNIVKSRWVESGLSNDQDAWGNELTEPICNDRVRQIGEQLNRIGGINFLMVARYNVAHRLCAEDPFLESFFNSDINWVWNGVGDWQA